MKELLLADLPADAAAVVSGRLFVSLTDTTLRNKLISEFSSRDELVDALACSCYVPAFSGYRTPRFRDRRYLDGGLTNNMPVLDTSNTGTVRVSPFSGPCKEISPADISVAQDSGGGCEADGRRKARRSVSLAGENFYMSRANLIRGLHAGGAVCEAQLASYYLAGYRDASQYFGRKSRVI